MIRVERGPEPPALTAVRSRFLARAVMAWLAWRDANQGEANGRFCDQIRGLLDEGYREAADALRDALRGLCAYCERGIADAGEIDHHRPIRDPKDKTHGGYWWLCWSWSNLLWSCGKCNKHKDTQYPVAGARLAPLTCPPGSEEPLLLDPCLDDPQRHLEVSHNPQVGWTIQGTTERGMQTAAVFKLDVRPERYAGHVRQLESFRTDLIQRAEDSSAADLQRFWERKVRLFLTDPWAEFEAFSRAWMALELAPLITRHALVLPPLPQPAGAPVAEPLWPPDPLAPAVHLREPLDPLGLAIRALNPERPGTEQRAAVLLAFAAAGGGTLAELESLTGRGRWDAPARQLAAEGRLSFEGTRVAAPGRAGA